MSKKIPTTRLTHPEYSIAFIAILFYTAIILTLAGCSEDSDDPEPDGAAGLRVGDAAPDFMLPKLGGGTLSLYDTRGEVVFIDFWATWCGPCKAAIPHLQKFYEKYKSEGLIVLGIDVWEYGGVDAVKKFKDDYKLTYDILLGTDTDVDSLYKVRGIPTMCLLDRNGVITWTQRGFGPGFEVEMEKQIKAALALQ